MRTSAIHTFLRRRTEGKQKKKVITSRRLWYRSLLSHDLFSLRFVCVCVCDIAYSEAVPSAHPPVLHILDYIYIGKLHGKGKLFSRGRECKARTDNIITTGDERKRRTAFSVNYRRVLPTTSGSIYVYSVNIYIGYIEMDVLIYSIWIYKSMKHFKIIIFFFTVRMSRVLAFIWICSKIYIRMYMRMKMLLTWTSWPFLFQIG